jgi:hypothetical protein
MNKDLFDQYLRDYVREALIYGDQKVDETANFLMSQRTPRFLVKKERKMALERAQKVFSAYRDRPLWFVLKCLGIESDEFDKA